MRTSPVSFPVDCGTTSTYCGPDVSAYAPPTTYFEYEPSVCGAYILTEVFVISPTHSPVW